MRKSNGTPAEKDREKLKHKSYSTGFQTLLFVSL